MTETINFDTARLRREAERCERLSEGVSDPALVSALRQWAEDYRREAEGRGAGARRHAMAAI